MKPTITLEAARFRAEPAKPEEPAPPEETAVQNADEVPQEDKEHRCGRPTGGVSADAAKAVLPNARRTKGDCP